MPEETNAPQPQNDEREAPAPVPDEHGLRPTDVNKVLHWLKTRCGTLRCHYCGRAQHTVIEEGGILLTYTPHTDRFHYGLGIPLVGLACNNCGHIALFSAVRMGLRVDQPPHHLGEGNGTPSHENP